MMLKTRLIDTLKKADSAESAFLNMNISFHIEQNCRIILSVPGRGLFISPTR